MGTYTQQHRGQSVTVTRVVRTFGKGKKARERVVYDALTTGPHKPRQENNFPSIAAAMQWGIGVINEQARWVEAT